MTDKHYIKKLFEDLEGTLDLEEPQKGHRERFMAKLETLPQKKPLPKSKLVWRKSLSIAAALLVLLTLTYNLSNTNTTVEQQVSRISPEIANTQYYFSGLVEEQIKLLQNEHSPITDKIISDTMIQLRTLEKDYQKMEQDLLNGGNSKLILSAMIGNFQIRIDLLNEVLLQIEEVKTIKENKNENSIT
ncbi:hypothetical protein [Arenibacter certesii]|uniref:DUF4179 domain-containing protein n=1 Tax=Arenibacter certesii TaxID=228955 RepID=A0A918MLC5_9FLAO|nr:hypothetical protein [Arenibacter certesii]GGW33170.1 hypothetical protein GCM10007383_17700 [Arenibacter certesii]